MNLTGQFNSTEELPCKLCGNIQPLEESHVIPNFVFKWLKASAAIPFMRFGAQPNRRIQQGFTRYWLCRSCEEKFNVWETKFANELFYPLVKGETDQAKYEDWLL